MSCDPQHKYIYKILQRSRLHRGEQGAQAALPTLSLLLQFHGQPRRPPEEQQVKMPPSECYSAILNLKHVLTDMDWGNASLPLQQICPPHCSHHSNHSSVTHPLINFPFSTMETNKNFLLCSQQSCHRNHGNTQDNWQFHQQLILL